MHLPCNTQTTKNLTLRYLPLALWAHLNTEPWGTQWAHTQMLTERRRGHGELWSHSAISVERERARCITDKRITARASSNSSFEISKLPQSSWGAVISRVLIFSAKVKGKISKPWCFWPLIFTGPHMVKASSGTNQEVKKIARGNSYFKEDGEDYTQKQRYCKG